MSKTATKGDQATPAAPAATPESNATPPSRQQVLGDVTKSFLAYHGLEQPATEAPEETEADAPAGESAAEETETALSQETETLADPSEESAETTDDEAGEGEADGDEAAEDTAAEDEDTVPTEPAKQPAWLQKRLERQARKHQEETNALKAQLEELRGQVEGKPETNPAPSPAAGEFDPVERVPEVQALRQQETQWQNAVGNCRQALRDLRNEPDAALERIQKLGFRVADVEAAEQLVNDELANYQDKLGAARSELAVARREVRKGVQQAAASCEALARQRFEWFDRKDDPRAVIVANTLKEMGPMAKHPSAKLLAGVWATFVHGEQEAAKAAKAKTKPAPPAKPTAKVVRPAKAATPQRGSASVPVTEKGTASSRGYFEGLASDMLKQNGSSR